MSQPPTVGPIAGAKVAVRPKMVMPIGCLMLRQPRAQDGDRRRDQHAAGKPLAGAEEDQLAAARSTVRTRTEKTMNRAVLMER